MNKWAIGLLVLGGILVVAVFGLLRATNDGSSPEARDATPGAPTSSSVTPTAPPTTVVATTATIPPSPQHHVFEQDTTFTERLVLRPGDTVELRNGACLCFGPGGSADWQGTPTSTWSDDGRTQNLERDIEISGEGHIRFMNGAETSEIRFVEIDLQPPQEVGKYPLHFHHAGDGVRGTIVEGVVIKNSTNRAFVSHASHGITFRDTIAKDVVGSGYWWDPPEAYSRDRSSNSDDITYDHALTDGVETFPGEPGYRLSAFFLGPGTGNAIMDSVAMNVGGRKDSSGFHWPGRHHSQPLTWRFENNVAHDNVANGLFVWQNNRQEHIIEGYTGYANGNADIDHGAYQNAYDYRDVEIDTMQIHALGWSVTGGSIGTVTTLRHAREGSPVTFTDVAIDRLIINNIANNGDAPGEYIFTNSGLTFADIVIEGAVPGTRVTIDGETRTY
jgi:hypothetical protein